MITSKLAQKFKTPVKIGADGTATQDTSLVGTADQAGLPQTPTLPGTADSLGASPDASKMAGTPAAQAASVSRVAPAAPSTTEVSKPSEPTPYKASASTPKTLAEADKGAAANAERVQTEDQAKRQQRQTQLQQAYGDVGLKVADLINLAIPKAVVPGTVYKVNDLPGNLASAQPALQAYAANPEDPKALAAAQKAIFDATGQSPSADAISSQYLSDISGGQAVAGRTPDQIALTPEILQQIGISPEDAQLLGLPSDLSKLSVADVSAAIKKAQVEGASSIADLAAVSQSDATGVGRAAAREVNKLAASSELSSEIATNQILDAAQEGQTLEINGQSYKIEDLLNDEKITDLVDAYLASPEGSPLRKQLDTQMPSLAKFALDNKTALDAGRKAAESVAGTVTKTQAANQAVRDKLAASLGMDDKAVRGELEGLVPELADQFATDAGNLDKVGLFSVLSDPAKYGFASGRAILDKAKQLKAADPEAFKVFAQMTPGEVQATGILSPDAEESSAGWSDFIEAVNEQEQVKKLPPEDLQKYFFGTGDLQSVWGNARAKYGAGDRSDMDRLGPLLDANRDGYLDPEDQVNARLKSQAQQASPTDLVKRLGLGEKIASGKKTVGGAGTEATGLAKQVSGFLSNDGKIDTKEIDSLDPNTPADQLTQLLKTTDKQDNNVQKALSAKIQKSKDLVVDKAFDSWGFEGPLKDAIYNSMYNPSKNITSKTKTIMGQKATSSGDFTTLNTEREKLQARTALDSINRMLESPNIGSLANTDNLRKAKDYLSRLLNPAAPGPSKGSHKTPIEAEIKNGLGNIAKTAAPAVLGAATGISAAGGKAAKRLGIS